MAHYIFKDKSYWFSRNRDFSDDIHQKNFIKSKNHNIQIYCGCQAEEVKMTAFHVRKSLISLRSHPNAKQLHIEKCPFYDFAASNDGRTSPAERAVKYDDEGKFDIKLNLKFLKEDTEKENTEEEAEVKEKPEKKIKKNSCKPERSVTTIGALLKHLYCSIGYSVHKPNSERTAQTMLGALYYAVNTNKISNKRASNLCRVIQPRQDQLTYNIFTGKNRVEVKNPLIIGLLEGYEETDDDRIRIYLVGYKEVIYIDKVLFYGLTDRKPNSPFVNNNYIGYDLIIVQVESIFAGKGHSKKTNKSYNIFEHEIRAHDAIDILSLDQNFTTYDSSYEYNYTQHLVDKKRKFEKPISSIDEDELCPDYILKDAGADEYYIEVWGMNTDEYLKRKEEKIKIYSERNWNLISYNPLKGDGYPQLPASQNKWFQNQYKTKLRDKILYPNKTKRGNPAIADIIKNKAKLIIMEREKLKDQVTQKSDPVIVHEKLNEKLENRIDPGIAPEKAEQHKPQIQYRDYISESLNSVDKLQPISVATAVSNDNFEGSIKLTQTEIEMLKLLSSSSSNDKTL